MRPFRLSGPRSIARKFFPAIPAIQKPDGGDGPSYDAYPVVFGVDPSPSTYYGNAREFIKEGFTDCTSQIQADPMLANQVEFALFALGTVSSTKCYVDFTPAKNFESPKIHTSFGSPIYELYCRLVGETIKRQDLLSRDHDRDVRTAWVFLFSDFQPTDPQNLDTAMQAKSLADEFGINLFMVGCGSQVDEQVISTLAQRHRPPVYMRSGHDFKQYFEWLYRSLRSKSMSQPGQNTSTKLFGTDLTFDG